MSEIVLTNQNFEAEVMQSDVPVLVDFWAVWCGPCKMLAPIVAEIAQEYEGKVKVGKVNVDDEPALAGRFGISSIPTLILFKNGQQAAVSVGVRPKEELVQMLQ
ncbi:MAG: thioredoxin [Lachnospiraceae bacterium]|jgi:thioredoxin 1|nr:thioredoxin [Lachnospiraceae bacterium]